MLRKKMCLGMTAFFLLTFPSCKNSEEAALQQNAANKNEEEIFFDDGSNEGNHSPWSDETGGQLAVVFTPPFYPAILKKVRFFVGTGGIPTTPFRVRVYAATVSSGPDDKDLLTSKVLASAEASFGHEWVEVDLSNQNIIFTSGDFCVAMEWLTAPGNMGSDAQFIGADYAKPDRRSWWKTHASSGWKRIEEVADEGDRDVMIRTTVEKK
jgi:hypothetical protein